MTDLKINAQRIKELERKEAKLAALEAGGVDNWDFYDDSLKDYYLANEKEECIDSLIDELQAVFGECAYEPSERGAGVAFDNSIEDKLIKLLITHKVTFEGLGGDDV